MPRFEAILTAALSITLAGCLLRGKPKAAAPPPIPAPVVAPAPPPPRENLSIPQTKVELPTPQPVTAEALAAQQPEEPPTPTPVQRRPPRSTPAPPKPEPTAPVATTPPAEPERPSIGEVVPADVQQRLAADAETRKREIRSRLDQLQGHRLNRREQDLVNRISSFVKASDDAQRKNDMKAAYDLAEKALILTRELPGGR